MAKVLTVGKWLKSLKPSLESLSFEEVKKLEPRILEAIDDAKQFEVVASGPAKGSAARIVNEWKKFYTDNYKSILTAKSAIEKKKFLAGSVLEVLHSVLVNEIGKKRKIGNKTYNLKFSSGRPYYSLEGVDELSTLEDHLGPRGFESLLVLISKNDNIMRYLVDNNIGLIMEKIPASNEHILVFSDSKNLKDQNKRIPIENFVKGLNFIGDEDDNQALSIVPADHNPADPFNVFKKILENPTDVDSTKLFNASKQFPDMSKVIKESLNKKLATGEITLGKYEIAISKLNESAFTPTTSDKIKYVKPVKRNPYKPKPGNVFN